MRITTVLSLVSVLLISTGCVSRGEGWRSDPATCAMVGGVAGGLIGAAISNPRHTKDDTGDTAVAAGAGVAAGAALGYALCAPAVDVAQAEPAPAPAPAPRARAPEVKPAPRRVLPQAPSRRIVLRGVNFAFDSAVLAPEAAVILDLAAQALEGSNARVQIVGHTDSIGATYYNSALSQRRALAVHDYLVRKGIAGSRLDVVGRGEAEPVADNATEDGRAQNRRVELNVQ